MALAAITIDARAFSGTMLPASTHITLDPVYDRFDAGLMYLGRIEVDIQATPVVVQLVTGIRYLVSGTSLREVYTTALIPTGAAALADLIMPVPDGGLSTSRWEELRALVMAGSSGGGLSVTDNGDGTLSLSAQAIADNGDGTLTIGV